MNFYDQDLKLVHPYDDITWGENNVFQYEGRMSQLVYFLSKVMPMDEKICIIPHVSLAHDAAANINASDIDTVVINASDHPLVFDDFKIFNKRCVYLDHNFNNTEYHAWHLLFSAWMSNRETVDLTSTRPFISSCLHGKSRYTRIFNMVELSKKPYFDTMYTHWEHTIKNITDPMIEDGLSGEDIINCFDDYLKLQQSMGCSLKFETEFDMVADLGKGFSDSYLNVVTESRIQNTGFLSEKIFKPFRCGQLLTLQGPPNTIKFLRDCGFDMFDDYIDHAYYDSELDWKKRTLLMHEVLDNIYPHIEDIFFKTADRRQANLDWLKSDTLMFNCLANINK